MAGANTPAAMFTVCPKCALTLVVTAADLRVAQGYVRCGRCSSVFNALARLSDDRQAADAAGGPAVAPEPESSAAVQEESADLSPLDEALSQPQEAETPELPATAEEPVSEDALEFDPETTDVGAVFVQPPPNPQWTAATGSFKAMRAASQQPTPEISTPSEAGNLQLDVEIDAAFLAELLREPAPADSARPPAAASPAEPPPPEASPPEALPAAPSRAADPLKHRAQPPRAAPPPAQPPARTPAETTAGAAMRRAALPRESPRQPERHAAPHARPPAEATSQPRSAAAREPPAPAREVPAHELIEQATSSALGLETQEATTKPRPVPRFRLPRQVPGAWAAGAACALLLLVAQIVNHYRDELATTPRFGQPLTALYASLGVQLVPRWDPRAYDVRQLGASADPAGSGLITVRASVKNAGEKPQPLPMLRVTLQDRFGNRIAARDVAPRFYVPRTVPESSSLAAGQRIDVEMGFVDPGANAVGFEIDACLPASGGGISCANDLAAR
jgi:predicted Zn finger-like uncharacterized protein